LTDPSRIFFIARDGDEAAPPFPDQAGKSFGTRENAAGFSLPRGQVRLLPGIVFFSMGGKMIRSGIIAGVSGFFLFLLTRLMVPLCEPFEAILLGLCVGFLAAVFIRPMTAGTAARQGAVAGLIASILAVIGETIGFLRRVDVLLVPGPTGDVPALLFRTEPSLEGSGTTVNVSSVISLSCCGITNVMLMVGLGALGDSNGIDGKARRHPIPDSRKRSCDQSALIRFA
jgi:hypothetical protein